MNTCFRYMYRDLHNNKAYEKVVFAGEATDADWDTIVGCCREGRYFVPEAVGLPHPGEMYDTFPIDGMDRVWCELFDNRRASLQSVAWMPTEPAVGVAEFVRRFQGADWAAAEVAARQEAQ